MALRPESAHARTSADTVPSLHRKSSFFKLSRRKKTQSLFPPRPPNSTDTGRSSGDVSSAQSDAVSLPPPDHSLSPTDFTRHPSTASVHSARSSPPTAGALLPFPARSRSGTTTSAPGHGHNHGHAHFLDGSGRNSSASTTLGRNSMAAIRGFTSRLRTSDALSVRHGTSSSGQPRASTATSFAMSRETLVIPDRDEGESPGKYFARIEKDYSKRAMALALSKSNDSFSHDVLRSLARTFKFYEEPVDMSLRKFLWEIPLTGEAQQIDRVLSAFSERYHECNPHIFVSADEANYVAFSLIILHSDLFNPQNRTKMTRPGYQKNTRDVEVPSEILGYFYDNIAYTEFISEDADNDDLEGRRTSKSAYKKVKKVKARLAAPEQTKTRAIDPYDIILDDRVNTDNLRPALKNELNLEDNFTYLSVQQRFDIPSLRAAFARYGVLQVVSERSRPEAFAAQSTIDNPNQAQAGVVSIKVAKVGIVWRKSAKKRKTRSPWQEWGVVLTASQLFLHRNISWIKSLMSQAEAHVKSPKSGSAVVFKPPLTSLAYDGALATHDAVALQDLSYKRHKHAFILARRSPNPIYQGQCFEETLLAESDADMHDWMAKINYASTFKTANIRMHPYLRTRRQSTGSGGSGGSGAAETPQVDVDDAVARSQQTKAKLTTVEDEAKEHVRQLENSLRAGRHLEILAPFMGKTRNELLAYGARLSHDIRWSRFDVLRAKCHREMLFKDLQQDESTTSSRGLVPVSAARFVPQGPKIDITSPSPRASEHPGRPASADGAVHSLDDDFAIDDDYGDTLLESIDEAFATPPDTLAQLESSHSLPVHVPVSSAPVAVPAASPASATISPSTAVAAASLPLDPPPSRASLASKSSAAASASVPAVSHPRGHSHSRDRDRSHGHGHRHTHSRDREKSSDRSRSRARPSSAASATSLSAGPPGPLPSEVAAAAAAAAAAEGSEGLARRPGSFTVHGKKASVVTLGDEWARVPAEERLRARKLESS